MSDFAPRPDAHPQIPWDRMADAGWSIALLAEPQPEPSVGSRIAYAPAPDARVGSASTP